MMATNEADRLAEVYHGYETNAGVQSQWSEANRGNRAILRERRQAMHDALRRAGLLPLTGRKILDVGCGTGKVLANLREWGATPGRLYGVDLLAERIATAKSKYPELNFEHVSGDALPFADESFDLVLLFTVFSSILDDAVAAGVAEQVDRVLRPGGAVLWYDLRYDNPRNPNVRGVRRAHIECLFPNYAVKLNSVTLLPPLARRLGIFTPALYPTLALLPPLRSHYLGLLIKPSERNDPSTR